MGSIRKTFTATLISPNGESSEYRVDARDKTEARKMIGKIYRQDTPSARYGFYSFSQHRLVWNEDAA